jgi:hypothetical protein
MAENLSQTAVVPGPRTGVRGIPEGVGEQDHAPAFSSGENAKMRSRL